MKRFFKKIFDIITVKVYRNQVIRYHENLDKNIQFLNTQLFLQNPILLINHVKIFIPLFYVDHIQKLIFNSRNFYELTTLEFLKNKYQTFGTVLEIGANIGNHMLYYCSHMEAKAVHCFEPNQFNYNILQKNVELNNLSNRVYLYKKAAGETYGKGIEKNFSQANTGMNRVERIPDESKSGDDVIEIVSIDSFQFSQVDFIKIDVEGFEMDVLKGARQTLQSSNAVLLIEVFKNNKAGVDEFMQSVGYTELITLEEYNVIYAKANRAN